MGAVPRDEDDVSAERLVEEAAIVARAQDDLGAFEPIYRRYYHPIFRYAFRRLEHREIAADATAQTFARALAGIHGFRGGTVAGWLFTIARHVVIDMTRQRRPSLDLDAAAHVVDPQRLPDERAIASDQQQALDRAIARLTPEQRQIVELRLAGLSGPEIADALSLSVSATKSSQFRAYARLRTLLADEHIFGNGS